MKKTKQNLILFFEETNDVIDINSKLVRLYMNRSVIDEEDQTEISGIYILSKSDENTQSIEIFQNLLRQLRNESLPSYARDLIEFQQQRVKLKNDRIIFEQSVSKIIESEMTRLREHDWFIEWRYEVHEDGGLEKWSGKKSGLSYLEWLKIKLTPPANEYTNHFVIGTSLYTSSYVPLRYLGAKAIIQSCFQRAILVQKYERKHELSQIELSYASDLLQYSTMVTVLRGTSANFLTVEQFQSIHAGVKYENNSITAELEDFYEYNMTTNEMFSKDEFKTLHCYKLLTDLDFRKLKFYYDKEKEENNNEMAYKFPFFEINDSGYAYIQCQRFSFPIARIPLRDQTSFFNKIPYFQNTSPKIRA